MFDNIGIFIGHEEKESIKITVSRIHRRSHRDVFVFVSCSVNLNSTFVQCAPMKKYFFTKTLRVVLLAMQFRCSLRTENTTKKWRIQIVCEAGPCARIDW